MKKSAYIVSGIVVTLLLILAAGAFNLSIARTDTIGQREFTREEGRVCGVPMLADHYRAAEIVMREKGRLKDEGGLDYLLNSKPKNKIGDPKVFWTYDLSIMPPRWVQIQATCRGVGRYCYVYVEDDEWGVHMDEDDVREVMYRFDASTPGTPEKGIFKMDTDVFGPTPDEIDNDPRIYIFYSALGGYGGTVFDGYFDPLSELTEEDARRFGGHSNEVEMFFMSCYPVDPTAESTLSVLAHEFQHMIHWNMDRNESTWMNEGCSELAMFLYGVPDPITGFPANPDNSLVEWDQEWADYIKSYLFTLYFYEKYGGETAVTTLVAEQENSIDGYEATLDSLGYDETFGDLFVKWTAANFLDDTTIGDGEYGYEGEDLPPFYATALSGYPVENKSGNTENWACDYLKFDDPGEITRALFFDGDDNATFRCIMLLTGDGTETVVDEMTLTGDMFGTAILDAGCGFDTPVMVVNNVADQYTKSYRYGTDLPILLSAEADDGEIPGAGIDEDDKVVIVFSYPSSKPEIDEENIDDLLPLSDGHSWLDGEGGVGTVSWNITGDSLIVELTAASGEPTVAPGDTITSYVDDTETRIVLGGQFDPSSITGEKNSNDNAEPAESPILTTRAIPNPFNPVTTITFTVLSETNVKLRIYDINGKLVADLLDGKVCKGNHSIVWQPSHLSSGVYISVLKTNSQRIIDRIVLLK